MSSISAADRCGGDNLEPAGLHTCQRKLKTTAIVVFLGAMLNVTATPAGALNIVLNFDAGMSDSPSFDADGSKLTAIMQSVESYWQDIIEDTHTLTVNYWWDDLNHTNSTFSLHNFV